MEDLKETPLIFDGNIVIGPEAGPDEYLEEYEEEDLGPEMGRDHRIRMGRRSGLYSPTTDRKHQCSACFYSTNDISNFRKHLKIHRISQTIPCPKCGYAAPNTRTLKSHMLVHTTENSFSCAICGFASKTKRGLKGHVKRHEKPKRPSFECAECGKTYTHKKSLENHLLRHGNRVHQCPDCDRKYPTKSRLRYHYRVHTGEKPFACTSCTYMGASRSLLRAHFISIHSTARPFVCSECNSGFKTITTLRLHSKVHSSGRPFSCQFCSYRHVRKVGVEQHIKLHHSSQFDMNSDTKIKTEEAQLISQTFACPKVEEEDTKSFNFAENSFNKDIDFSVDVIKSE